MKKSVTIFIIVVLVLGFGVFLYKISPQQAGPALFDDTPKQELASPSEANSEDHVLGNPAAKNTMVAYEDLQCPACASFEPTLMEIPKQLVDTKLVFRHLPLSSLHKNAAVAALASEAASAQGKFWEFIELLYKNQADWSDLQNPIDKFSEYARQAGVADIPRFASEVASQKHKDRVQRDVTEAANLKVQGTPTLFFNGQRIELGDIAVIKEQVAGKYK